MESWIPAQKSYHLRFPGYRLMVKFSFENNYRGKQARYVCKAYLQNIRIFNRVILFYLLCMQKLTFLPIILSLYWKCNFLLNRSVRRLGSVGQFVSCSLGWLVVRSVCHNLLKDEKLHFRAPIHYRPPDCLASQGVREFRRIPNIFYNDCYPSIYLSIYVHIV